MKKLFFVILTIVALSVFTFGQNTEVTTQSSTNLTGTVLIKTNDQTVTIKPVTGTRTVTTGGTNRTVQRRVRRGVRNTTTQQQTYVSGYTGTVSGQEIQAQVTIDGQQVTKIVTEQTQGQFNSLSDRQDQTDERLDTYIVQQNGINSQQVNTNNQLFANDKMLDGKITQVNNNVIAVNNQQTQWNQQQDKEIKSLKTWTTINTIWNAGNTALGIFNLFRGGGSNSNTVNNNGGGGNNCRSSYSNRCGNGGGGGGNDNNCNTRFGQRCNDNGGPFNQPIRVPPGSGSSDGNYNNTNTNTGGYNTGGYNTGGGYNSGGNTTNTGGTGYNTPVKLN